MIELIKKDKKSGRVTFELKGTPAFANSLRRAMMDSVPSMAIDEVEFVQNDGVLYDEVLAHRLGLVPLSTDLKGYEVRKPGDELNAKNSVKLVLKVKGPCTVYSEDLKSKDPKIKPVFPKMPLTKLLKNQELEFVATAVLGTGREHVKFSPCLAHYSFKSKVTVNNNHKDFEKFRESYPPQVFSNGKIDVKLIEQHNLFDACEGVNNEIVKVERDASTFIFNIEPWGQLSPSEILACAVDHLSGLFDEFIDKLSKP